MSEMMELKPQEEELKDQNQDLQERNDAFTNESASEDLIQKNDDAVEEESEYPPSAVEEWQDHKQEGGSDHEQITQ